MMKIATSYTRLTLFCTTLFLLYFVHKTQLFDEKKEKTNTFSSELVQENKRYDPIQTVTQYKIKNNITSAMLTYKHWTGSYQPSSFVISINGTPLPQNETTVISGSPQNTLFIRYDYSFLHGYRTGSREIEFALSNHTDMLNLTFSWHIPTHLILENATVVSEKILPYNTQLEQEQNA